MTKVKQTKNVGTKVKQLGGNIKETEVKQTTEEIKTEKVGFGTKVMSWVKKNKGVLIAAGVGVAAGVYIANRNGDDDSDDVLELTYDLEDETFKYDEGYSNEDEEA